MAGDGLTRKEKKDWAKPHGDGCLYEVVDLFAHSIEKTETEWEQDVLTKKLRGYFVKAAKNMVYQGKKLDKCVEEYAANCVAGLHGGLSERPWFSNEQPKMVLLLDAAIKDIFPGGLFKDVSQAEFEVMVSLAYDKACDNQHFEPLLTEAVAAAVSGPKIKKKVWNAIDEARRIALDKNTTNAEEFLQTWCGKTVELLAKACQQGPEQALLADQLSQLFLNLVSGGGLPRTVKQNEGQGSQLDIVDQTIHAAYIEHAPEPTLDVNSGLGGLGGPPLKALKGEMATALS